MHIQTLKIVCNDGQQSETEILLAKYVKGANNNPGFVHGSWWKPEAAPNDSTPSGFSIRDRDVTYFIYLAFRSARDMLRHVELYNEGETALPVPHDYMLGIFNEDQRFEVTNKYV